MKASKFTDAQKAFIIRQGEEGGAGRRDPPEGRHQPGEVKRLRELEEENGRAYFESDHFIGGGSH